MIIDIEKVAALIKEIAAEEIVPRFGALNAADIDTKSGPSDFVTAADRGAEQKLEKVLSDLYPAAAFIGEESVAGNMDKVSVLAGDGAFWVVDPVDGTRNFVEGRPEFGVIVALVENGETRAGWIYAVPDDAFAVGSKGDGASWRNERLTPLPPEDRDFHGYRAVGSLKEPWKTRLTPRLREAFNTDPITCSAYGYIRLLTGARQFALYSRCHPWDHAAGQMMLGEIAGKARYLDDGAPYLPLPTMGRPLLVAGNGENWRKVEDTLLK